MTNVIRTLALALVVANTAFAAEQFVLHNPLDPSSQSLVYLSPNEMVVIAKPNTPQQREYTYERVPLMDSPYYRAFYNAANDRYIRWPVSSQGHPLRMVGYGQWQPIKHEIYPVPPTVPVVPLAPPTQISENVPNAPLYPATVELINRHDQHLIVTIIDRRDPNARPVELTIPSGGSVRQRLDRDAGSTDRTILVAATGEVLGVLAEKAIAPQSIYEIVVHEYKPVSVYIDRTGKDQWAPQRFRPANVRLGARSIGVFSVPAGDQLWDGAQLDVYDEAKYRGNPGAASLYAAAPRP